MESIKGYYMETQDYVVLYFYITFFNILQQKALRSAYQEPSVCVQSFS